MRFNFYETVKFGLASILHLSKSKLLRNFNFPTCLGPVNIELLEI